MRTILSRKLLYLTVLVLVVSPAILQANALSHPASLQKISKTSSTSSSDSILTIQRQINQTTVEVNQSIFIELILTNQGDNPVYNVTLTEYSVQNPEIVTKNLFSPLVFAQFDAHEQRIISYSITALKVVNITLDQTVVTYQQSDSPSAPIFTSYSTKGFVIIKPVTVSQNTLNLNYLIIVSVLALFYSLILIVRIFFNIFKKSKS